MTPPLLSTVSRNNRPPILFPLVLLLSLVPMRALAQIPPLLYGLEYADPSYPAWVSAHAALDSSGDLDTALFHPVHIVTIENNLKAPFDADRGCTPISEYYDSYAKPADRSSLAKAIAHSDFIILGEVAERDFGFDRGTPGQLFRLEARRILKGTSRTPVYYFFVPVGRFELGPHTICKMDLGYPSPPELGDTVLIMVPEREDDREPFLDLQTNLSLITLRRDGSIGLPRRFPDSDSEQLRLLSGSDAAAALLRRVEALVRGDAPR